MKAHEGVGHTLQKHVGKSLEDLQRRLAGEGRRKAVSTFRTQGEAEAAVEATLRANESKIRRWLVDANGSEAFRADLGRDVGDVLVRGSADLVAASKVKVVLVADEKMAAGWRLITAHPEL